MVELGPKAETETRFKSLEKGLSTKIERGSPVCIASDDSENPQVQLTLNSVRSWSIQVGERSIKIGVNPLMLNLLNAYALVKDSDYVELARQECRDPSDRSRYLLENRDRLFEGLVSDMQTVNKTLKPSTPFIIRVFKSIF